MSVVAVLAVIGIGVGVMAGTNTGGLGQAGTVHGLLGGYQVGGPKAAPPRFVSLSGTVQAFSGSTVVATVAVPRTGKFVLQLPPGSYRLQGRWQPNKQTCGPTVLRVRANLSTSVKVLCPLPIIQ